jgi:hypothetical protein
MQKTLTIKELKSDIVMRVTVTTNRGSSTKEIARFANSGMGWCALGASGRYLLQYMNFDHVQFDGSRETYDRLVSIGVIEVMTAEAA